MSHVSSSLQATMYRLEHTYPWFRIAGTEHGERSGTVESINLLLGALRCHAINNRNSTITLKSPQLLQSHIILLV